VAIKRDGAVLRQVSTLFNVGVIRDLTDGQLLERFANGQGEAAELAFAALVDRHGAMVLRVCRARLADPHDALDAFQATFLILIEKAPGLWVRDSLGPWLHAVALRTATRARSAAARRRQVERQAAGRAIDRDQDADRDRERALHEEIDRLPERYRVPIVLCDHEGLTCEDVARKLGRPVGTVKSWRARGRERLRQRLTRAGLAPSVGLSAVTTPEMNEAIRAVLARLTAGTVPASVGVLVKGVLKTMFIKKLGAAAAMLGTLTFAAAGVGSFVRVAADDPPEPPRPEARIQPAPAPNLGLSEDSWPLTLGEAIRMGLDHRGDYRVMSGPSHDGPLKVAPVKAGADGFEFKAELMSFVRSIEERYWSLAQQHVRLWAAERAVEFGKEILRREQVAMRGGHATVAYVAGAQRRLEQFNLDLVSRTSDVITAERQLRNILGQPPAGSRRIVPVTAPVEAKLEPDWEKSLSEMLEKQPDVARAKLEAKTRRTDLDAITRNFLPDLVDEGPFTPSPDPAHGNPVAPESRLFQQAVRQTTHALGRCFLEIDAEYKQYQASKKLRAVAEERLAAQRAQYDEGRITMDRYSDAVGPYAEAVAQEARSKAAYNLAIVRFEEARGTLLERDKITLVERPSGGAQAGEVEASARKLVFKTPAPAERAPSPEIHEAPAPRPEPKPAPPTPASPSPTVADQGRTTSFRATIQIGAVPIEIRGSFTVGPTAP
jgi:RNA polymerase sigma factor (sigma-70 family)